MLDVSSPRRHFLWWTATSLVAGCAAVLLSLAEGQDSDFIKHTLRVDKELSELLSAAQDIEIGQRGYLVTRDERFLEPYRSAQPRIDTGLQHVIRLVSDNPEQTRRVFAMKSTLDEIRAVSARTISLQQSGDPSAALALVMEGRGKRVMDRLRADIAEAKASEQQLYAERQSRHQRRRQLLGAALIVLLLSSGVLAMLMRASEQERALATEKANQALMEANATLEKRVAQRTAELASARDRAEALLRDVTHRIGNTLALVVGFLNLQMRHVTDPAAASTLVSARERIMAISSAQRRINVANDLEMVRIDQLISGVMEDLMAAHEDDRVAITLDIPELTASAQDATSLCVLTQEFVVNALKHGFPEGRTGRIQVKLHRNEDGGARLTVTDNGQGHAEEDGGTAKPAGLGMKIAARLAQQFGGTIEIASGPSVGKGSRGISVLVDLPGLKLSQA